MMLIFSFSAFLISCSAFAKGFPLMIESAVTPPKPGIFNSFTFGVLNAFYAEPQ
jgi:hypothetical protein